MPTAPDPLCAVALALTMLVALRASPGPYGLGREMREGAALPAWVPVLTLGALALASTIVGILDPQGFLALADT